MKFKLRNLASNKLRHIFGISMIVFSFIFNLYGMRNSIYNVQIYSIFLLSFGIVCSLSDKENILFNIFILIFLVFLVNMPLIDSIRGKKWWSEDYDLNYLSLSISILYVSIILLLIGYKYKQFFLKPAPNILREIADYLKKILTNLNSKIGLIFDKFTMPRIISFQNSLIIIYTLTFICSMYMELDKLIFMKDKIYEDFYVLYRVDYPSIVSIIGNMNIYFLMAILALKPNKKFSFIVLFLNLTKTLPLLIIGKRSPFILALILSLIYYLLRDLNGDNEKWMGKAEISLLILGIPSLLIFMTLINYSRSGFQTHGIKVFQYIIDFLYRQGITFKIHTLGVENYQAISEFSNGRNYLFGEILDIFKYGRLGQILFGNPELPLGNSIFAANNSSNYAHSLAYLVHPKYLNGHGYGSSYILEGFQTYGLVGLVIVNLFIGALIKKINDIFKRGFFSRYMSLLIIERLFFVSRSSFSSLFSFTIKPSFIVASLFIIFIYFATKTTINNKGEINCDS